MMNRFKICKIGLALCWTCFAFYYSSGQYVLRKAEDFHLPDPSTSTLDTFLRMGTILTRPGEILFCSADYNGYWYTDSSGHLLLTDKVNFWTISNRGNAWQLGISQICINSPGHFYLGHHYWFSDDDRSGETVTRPHPFHFPRHLTNAASPYLFIPSRVTSDSSFNLCIPVASSLQRKNRLLKKQEIYEIISSDARVAILEFTKHRGQWICNYKRAFGTYRHDQGIRNAFLPFCNPSVLYTDTQLYLTSASSHWIWQYDYDGILLDSMNAQGSEMPDTFILKMNELSRDTYVRTFKDSGSYGKLFYYEPLGKYIRTYTPPKSAHSTRKTFLQIIDWKKKTKDEIEIDPGQMISCIVHGKICFWQTPVSANGHLTFRMHEITDR